MLYNAGMDKFYAISDPTRRKILEILACHGELSATEICAEFPVSSPAISQHLKVLRQANLVFMEKRAQKRIYRINPEAMLELENWARDTSQLWIQRFEALEKLLEVESKTLDKEKLQDGH